MTVAILKYPAGNIFSVQAAIKRLGGESIVTDDKETLKKSEKIIIPGQGEAASTMAYLRRYGMDEFIRELQQPVLGICIGMQLMCATSEEGNANCMSIFPQIRVKKFIPANKEKIPQMGWNSITNLRSRLFRNIDENSYVYFVHSYYVPVCEYTTAVSDYTGSFSAAMELNNFYAVQFHPEKSGKVGEQILQNFLDM